MMDPEFRSSDIESDGEPSSNTHAHYGAAPIERLLGLDAMTLRSKPLPERICDRSLLIQSPVTVSSKKALKHLSLSKGNKTPSNSIPLWRNRWHVFEKEILGRSTPQTPKCEDIVRFFPQVPEFVQPKGEKHSNMISTETIKTGLQSLFKHFTFTYIISTITTYGPY